MVGIFPGLAMTERKVRVSRPVNNALNSSSADRHAAAMIFRAATESDAEGIAAIIQQMKELKWVGSVPRAELAAIVGDNLRQAAAGRSLVLVAESADGQLAGYCAVHWVPILFFAGGEAYVTELFVVPPQAGQGVGSRLLKAAETEARRWGCSRLSLMNGRDGESYRRKFYQKQGWSERDRMTNFILPLAPKPDAAPRPSAN
jgi:GNAT superfamily N-acetyltransferase